MNRIITLGAVALAVVAGAAYWLNSAPAPATGEIPFAATAQESAEDGSAAEDVDTSTIQEMTLGDPDAPVTMIEYASFTCPHCADFHANQFKKLKKDYIATGKVHFIYRDVYFDRFGLWASMVARCGGEDRFFGITDMIYAQQKEWIGDGQDPVAIAEPAAQDRQGGGAGGRHARRLPQGRQMGQDALQLVPRECRRRRGELDAELRHQRRKVFQPVL